MEKDYEVKYEDSFDQNLYTDGDDKRPKLVLIVIGIVILLIIILIFFFACSGKDSKSNNNYLSNLSVSNANLNPMFQKDTLIYSVTATEDFTTVSCSSESSKAVTDGCNKRIYLTEECNEHIIKVTSESKEIREYKLNICKQSKEAPVIKNVKLLPDGYTKDKVTVVVEVMSTDKLNKKAYSFDGGKTWQSSNSLTVTENKTLEIKIRDKNNNESAIFTKEIKTIDKIKPSVSIKGSTESGVSTTSNVVLTATVSPSTTSSGYKYQWYKGENIIKGANNNVYIATTSGDYKVKVTTGSGNFATSNIFKVNIKKSTTTGYTIDIKVKKSTDKWTKDNVKLIIEAKASNGLASDAYSFDGGKSFGKNNSKTFSSNQTVDIVVKDKKGNKSTHREYITNIDKIVPTVSITGNNTVGSKLTAKVSPTSTASKYYYQWYLNTEVISGATSSTYTTKEAGRYEVKVTTGANNSKISAVFVVKVKVVPSVILTSSVEDGQWTNKNVTLTATPVNGTVSSYTWYANNKVVGTTKTNTYTINTDTNATYKVIAKFTDDSEKTSGTVNVKVDKTDPNVPVLKYTVDSYSGSTYVLETWINKTVYRQIKANDTSSGIDHFEYQDVSASASTCSGSKTGNETLKDATNGINNNRYYKISYAPTSSNYACFRTVDKAGNVSDWTSVQKIKIDKIVPYTPIPTKNTLNCYAESNQNKIVPNKTLTTENLFCGGYVTSHGYGLLEEDSGGSGIDYCEGIVELIGESTASGCKNIGDVGNMKFIDDKTGNYKFSNVNTANWVNLSTVNVCAKNASQVVYIKRCHDRAGNVGNIVMVWAVK